MTDQDLVIALAQAQERGDRWRDIGPVLPKYLPICGDVRVMNDWSVDQGLPRFIVCNLHKGHEGSHENGEDDHGKAAWR